MKKFKRFATLFLCATLVASMLHVGVFAEEYVQVIYQQEFITEDMYTPIYEENIIEKPSYDIQEDFYEEVYEPEIPYYYTNDEYYDDYTKYYEEDDEYDVLPMAVVPVMPLNLVTGVINNSTNAVTPSAGNATWTFDPATNIVTIHGGPGIYANQQGRGSTSPWQRAGIADYVHRIVFDGPVVGRAFLFGLFNGMPNLVEIENLHYLNTSQVQTMQHMFRHTPSLTSLDLSTFDTSNVQSFNGTFQNTGVTEILGLETWDMSNVTNVSQMFLQARNLQWINTTGWSFNNIATTGVAAGFPQMFEQTDSLHTIIGIETWNVDNLVRTERMFRDALSLQSLDLSGWNVSNVTNMIHMFSGARSLHTVNTTGWNTGNVQHMHYMFANSNIDIGTFNTTHALTSIPGIEGWNTANVITMQNMFDNAFSLPALSLSGWNTGNVERMDSMFRRTHALTTVGDLSSWNVGNVVNMAGMFDMTNPDGRISQLTSIGDVRNWDTSNVSFMQNMFRDTVFTQLNLSGWDTSSVTNMNEMFRGARDLWRLNLQNWNTGSIANPGSMNGMFMDTLALRQLTLGAGWTVFGGGNATLLPSVPGNGSWRNVNRDAGGTAWAPLMPDANGLIFPDLNNPAAPAGNHDFTSDTFMSNPLAPSEIADTWVWVNRAHYPVTFNLAGGNVNNNTDSIEYSLPAGIPVGADRVPSPVLRQNSMFTGWRYDGQAVSTPNLTDLQVARWEVNGPQTFIAQWIGYTYNVVFDLNGGFVNGGTANIIHTVPHNQAVGIHRVPTPTLADHSFLGWRYDGQADGTPNLTLADAAARVVTADIIFTAQWVSPPVGLYPVIFDLHGGVYNGNTADITHMLFVDNPVGAENLPEPIRGGYTFLGWRYNGQAQGTPNLTGLQAARKTVTGPHIFTAQWEAVLTETLPQPYCVIFSLTGGSVGGNQASVMYKIGTNDMVGANRVPTPVRTGWTFEGWRINGQAAGTPNLTAAEIASHVVISDIIFVAQWAYSGGNSGGNTAQPPVIQPPVTPPQTTPQPQPQPVYTPQPTPESTQWAPHAIANVEVLYVDYEGYFVGYYEPVELIPIDPTPIAETHYAFMIGFAEDGTIRPHANITRAEVATIFFRLITDEYRASVWTQTNSFADVQLDRWFNNAISTMENSGLFAGMPLGENFGPNQAATRAEFAAMVVNYLGLGHYRSTGGNAFTDIEGHWASDAINVAYLQGWINGFGDGTFRPDELITRAQVAALVNRALGRLPETADDLLEGMVMWPDNMNPNAWYFLYIQEATNSHYHVKKEDGIHETWTHLIDPRNWRSLERPYSRPYNIFN